MTDDVSRRVEELDALAAKATPGEWVGPWGDTHTIAAFGGTHDWTPETDKRGDAFPLAQYIHPTDAAFITALVNAWRTWLRAAALAPEQTNPAHRALIERKP